MQLCVLLVWASCRVSFSLAPITAHAMEGEGLGASLWKSKAGEYCSLKPSISTLAVVHLAELYALLLKTWLEHKLKKLCVFVRFSAKVWPACWPLICGRECACVYPCMCPRTHKVVHGDSYASKTALDISYIRHQKPRSRSCSGFWRMQTR